MRQTFFNKFSLSHDKESLENVVSNIERGLVFRGTNLWILIFAILVASLGLNRNSSAVVIGAMLISPIMGPIMGIGLGIGINDIAILRKAITNFAVATVVALSTSTVYFLLSPLNEAHSEILARTSPNIYDVLIALFGGFAGVVATTSKFKGNVIPGVAIATALMPPLCTAGYGLATLQISFFLGAFYLFVINTVFIALSTFIIIRILHFPVQEVKNTRAEKMAHRIVWLVVLITLIPSLYFGYDLVQRDKFTNNANRFVNNEAHFTNDYLLNKKIDAETNSIVLVFGGAEISQEQINKLKAQLPKYSLDKTVLEVKQGFAYLGNESKDDVQAADLNQLSNILSQKEIELKRYQVSDTLKQYDTLARQIFRELKTNYNNVTSTAIQPIRTYKDSSIVQRRFIVLLSVSRSFSRTEKIKIENWLKVRLRRSDLQLIIQ